MLREFVSDWLATHSIDRSAPVTDRVGECVGTILYRDDRFQVQLWDVAPGGVVADHNHPDIESWVVLLGGRFSLRKHGTELRRKDVTFLDYQGHKVGMVHLAPGDVHGFRAHDTGGSLLSISERLDGEKPVSVHLNWNGEPLNADHATELGII